MCFTSADWTNRVFADFSTLVAFCNDIVSVGVPQSMQRIAAVLLKEKGKEYVPRIISFRNVVRVLMSICALNIFYPNDI